MTTCAWCGREWAGVDKKGRPRQTCSHECHVAFVASKRRGVPLGGDFSERFWAKVDRSAGLDGCWPWLGTRQARGYGQIWRDGRNVPATAVALELAGRPLPEGMVAMHSCDNSPCVNPAHLRGGTTAENAQDMLAKGRDAIVGDKHWTRLHPDRVLRGASHWRSKRRSESG